MGDLCRNPRAVVVDSDPAAAVARSDAKIDVIVDVTRSTVLRASTPDRFRTGACRPTGSPTIARGYDRPRTRRPRVMRTKKVVRRLRRSGPIRTSRERDAECADSLLPPARVGTGSRAVAPVAPAAARDALPSVTIEPNGSLCGCDLVATYGLDGERLSSRLPIQQRWCQLRRATCRRISRVRRERR